MWSIGKDDSYKNVMTVDTPTHCTEVDTLHNQVWDNYSYRDDSNAPFRDRDWNPTDFRKFWRDCVGTWIVRPVRVI